MFIHRGRKDDAMEPATWLSCYVVATMSCGLRDNACLSASVWLEDVSAYLPLSNALRCARYLLFASLAPEKQRQIVFARMH